MFKSLKFVFIVAVMGLSLTACNKSDGGAGAPAPPQCVPGQPCNVNPPGAQCPFGQYWNGTQCIAGNNVGGNYKQYYANYLNISNTKKAENIYEFLTGQYFCLGTPGICPNFNQGAVEIVIIGNAAQVRMVIGGQSYQSISIWGQGALRNINNDTGSQIDVLMVNQNFSFITTNYRLDLGGTKDGALSNSTSLQVLDNNAAFGTGQLYKYGN